MITLALFAVVAAGAVNTALVAFVADRLSSKSSAAGEFVAITETSPTAQKAGAVKVGNENVPAVATKIAA